MITAAQCRASAAKRGRNPAFPYVPVIDYGEQKIGVHRTRTEQIRARAFATREEAVAYAERVIAAREQELTRKLADPRHRALRQQYGVIE
jgi:hypothetical protein